MRKRVGIVLIIIVVIINIFIIYENTKLSQNDANNVENQISNKSENDNNTNLNNENANNLDNNANNLDNNENTLNSEVTNNTTSINIENEISSNNFEKVNKYWANSDGFIAMSGFISNVPSTNLNEKDGYIQISFSNTIEEKYNILLIAYKGKSGEYKRVEYKDKVLSDYTIELKSEDDIDITSKTFDSYIIIENKQTKDRICLNLNCKFEEV